MKIDWIRKLTSRKLWLAVATFVSMLIVYFTGLIPFHQHTVS